MRARDRWHDRLKQVEREFVAASAATDLLEERLRSDPAYLRSRNVGMSDSDRMRRGLEATYLIRLYAVFEAALRDVWSASFGKATEPPMRDLIEAIAGRRRTVSIDLRDRVHVVREYRNTVVHGGEGEPISLTEARRWLNRFLSHLPEDW